MSNTIDTTFDFRSDTPRGKDPDAHSKTLRAYHKQLWSKALPNGRPFALDDGTAGVYLHHKSDLGEFFLSSDSAIHTYTRVAKMAPIVTQLREGEAEDFRRLSYTMGGMIIFPSNKVEGKATINAARGMHPRIGDRIDLTLECIRRHYIQEPSPLSDVLSRYADFFALFDCFRGYVEFFLLQDLVTDDLTGIKFLMPFDGFSTSALPQNLENYLAYKVRTIQFVEERNLRIREFCS